MKLGSLPRQLPESVYASTRETVRKKYAAIPGVLAVLEFGTIPYPGISDMDFLIITEPNRAVRLPHLSEYTEDERYAMGHRHYAVSGGVYPFLDYVDPWFVQVDPLVDPSGRFAFKKGSFSASGYEALSLNFIHQKLTFGSVPYLAQALATGTLGVRHFFEEIKLFRYFLREFRKLAVPRIEEDPALERYDAVARTWFAMSSAEQLAAMEEVFERYKDSIRRAYRMLEAAIASRHGTQNTGEALRPQTRAAKKWLRQYPQSLVVDTGAHVYVYQQGRRTLSVVQQSGVTVYLFPWSLGCFATPHLFLRGSLSDHYRTLVCTDLADVPVWNHADLQFLAHLDNQNLWETRSVENCKYYQMTYGFRPGGRRSIFARIAAALDLSWMSSLLAGSRKKVLWEVQL